MLEGFGLAARPWPFGFWRVVCFEFLCDLANPDWPPSFTGAADCGRLGLFQASPFLLGESLFFIFFAFNQNHFDFRPVKFQLGQPVFQQRLEQHV
jgi:hypothetical protein